MLKIGYRSWEFRQSIVVQPDQPHTIRGANLAPGVYFLNMEVNDVKLLPRKLIKIQ